MSIKQWENIRDVPNLQQIKGHRAASSDVHIILVSLNNHKLRIKYVSNISDNGNECAVDGSEKGVETRSYLSK